MEVTSGPAIRCEKGGWTGLDASNPLAHSAATPTHDIGHHQIRKERIVVVQHLAGRLGLASMVGMVGRVGLGTYLSRVEVGDGRGNPESSPTLTALR